MYAHIILFFQNGGLFMYPIAIVLALAIAVSIERAIFLLKATRENRDMWSKLSPLLSKGDLDGAASLAESSKSAIARILESGLAQARTDRRRSEVEIATEEGLMEVL